MSLLKCLDLPTDSANSSSIFNSQNPSATELGNGMLVQKTHQTPTHEMSILSMEVEVEGGGERLYKTHSNLVYPSSFCQLAAPGFLSWKLGVNHHA